MSSCSLVKHLWKLILVFSSIFTMTEFVEQHSWVKSGAEPIRISNFETFPNNCMCKTKGYELYKSLKHGPRLVEDLTQS